MATKEVGFSKKFESAVAVVEAAKAMLVRNPQEYAAAEGKLGVIRDLETELAAEYKAHPIVIEAKRLQGIKGDLATLLENARKGLKNGQMLAFERAEEAKRVAEEKRLQAEAQAAADLEAKRQLVEKKKEFDRLQKLRKAAEKKGDDEAAAAAAAAAEQTRQDALRLKQEPATVATVVLEKTAPTTNRTTVFRWRLTTKDGRVFTKDDFKKVVRLRPAELKDGVPPGCFVLDHTSVSGLVDSLGQNHGIPGVEVWTETV
jgi:hypothetical protein